MGIGLRGRLFSLVIALVLFGATNASAGVIRRCMNRLKAIVMLEILPELRAHRATIRKPLDRCESHKEVSEVFPNVLAVQRPNLKKIATEQIHDVVYFLKNPIYLMGDVAAADRLRFLHGKFGADSTAFRLALDLKHTRWAGLQLLEAWDQTHGTDFALQVVNETLLQMPREPSITNDLENFAIGIARRRNDLSLIRPWLKSRIHTLRSYAPRANASDPRELETFDRMLYVYFRNAYLFNDVALLSRAVEEKLFDRFLPTDREKLLYRNGRGSPQSHYYDNIFMYKQRAEVLVKFLRREKREHLIGVYEQRAVFYKSLLDEKEDPPASQTTSEPDLGAYANPWELIEDESSGTTPPPAVASRAPRPDFRKLHLFLERTKSFSKDERDALTAVWNTPISFSEKISLTIAGFKMEEIDDMLTYFHLLPASD